MTFKISMLFWYCFLTAFAAKALQQNNVHSNSPTQLNHSVLIKQFESGLKPRYGAANEPAVNWRLAERMDFYKVPSLSIAVAIDGKLAWAKAYGETVKGSGERADNNTLFQVASLSKPVASLAALKLVAANKLDLDSPVNQYLKTWQIPTNEFTRKTPVTLRHLLSHRAGTNIHGFKGYQPSDAIPTSMQIVAGLSPANTAPVVVEQEPGTRYRYSGGGFQIAQLAIEDVTSMGYARFVKNSILEPLSLTRSNFAYPQTDDNAAIGHVGPDSTPIKGTGYVYPELAAAGLWSTPSELVKLGSAIARNSVGKKALLPAGIIKQLIPDSAKSEGLGFGLNDDGDGVVFVHNGHNPGFSARWFNYADGRASVAVFTNSDSGGELIREVLSSLGHVYGWKQDAYVQRNTVDISPDWAHNVIGDYYFGGDHNEIAAAIWVEDGKLWIEGLIAERTRLFPLSTTQFFIANGLNMTLQIENKQSIILDIEGELTLTKKQPDTQSGN